MFLQKRCSQRPNRVHGGPVVAVGVFLTVVFGIVLFMVGSPRGLLLVASRRIRVMPCWLFLTLCFSFYFLGGASLGRVLFQKRSACDAARYRGAFLFSLGIVCSYLWYAITFGSHFFFVSLLFSLIGLAFLVLSLLNFRRAVPTAFWGTVLLTVWQVYLLVLTVRLFFFL